MVGFSRPFLRTDSSYWSGNLYPQPCQHYRSVGLARILQRIGCAEVPVNWQPRQAPREWTAERHKEWTSYNTKSYFDPRGTFKAVSCQLITRLKVPMLTLLIYLEIKFRLTSGPHLIFGVSVTLRKSGSDTCQAARMEVGS